MQRIGSGKPTNLVESAADESQYDKRAARTIMDEFLLPVQASGSISSGAPE